MCHWLDAVENNVFSQAATEGPPCQEVTTRLAFSMINPGYAYCHRDRTDKAEGRAGRRRSRAFANLRIDLTEYPVFIEAIQNAGAP